jgi:hypothetical protein
MNILVILKNLRKYLYLNGNIKLLIIKLLFIFYKLNNNNKILLIFKNKYLYIFL